MTELLLIIGAVLIGLAIAAVIYRLLAESGRSTQFRHTLLSGGLIIAGLLGLELAVLQTLVERL